MINAVSGSACFLLLTLAMATVALSSFAADALDDFIVIPGVRMGFIGRDTRESELIERLGRERVERVLYDASGEGAYRCATQVTFDAGHKITVLWKGRTQETDSDSPSALHACAARPPFAAPESIAIDAGRWQTRDGMPFNASLKTLENYNGQPVIFRVGDSESTEVQWNHGRFARHLAAWLQYPEDFTRDYDGRQISSADLPPGVASEIRLARVEVLMQP